jgi:hypothetical protein
MPAAVMSETPDPAKAHHHSRSPANTGEETACTDLMWRSKRLDLSPSMVLWPCGRPHRADAGPGRCATASDGRCRRLNAPTLGSRCSPPPRWSRGHARPRRADPGEVERIWVPHAAWMLIAPAVHSTRTPLARSPGRDRHPGCRHSSTRPGDTPIWAWSVGDGLGGSGRVRTVRQVCTA